MLAFRAGAAVSTETIMLLLLLALVADVAPHKCYNCGPRDQGFKQTCDQFDSNPKLYAEECDSNYFGCSIQVQASQVIRQCEEHKLNDCKIANDVTYCYCSSELCNSVTSQDIMNNDDEDIVDGSGADEVLEELFTTVPPASTAATFPCKLALLMISIMLH